MSVKETNKDILVKINKQLISINNAVLLNRKKIIEFRQSGKKNDKELLLKIRRQLRAINNKVLINQHTIGTKLVLSGKKYNTDALKKIKQQLQTIQKNVLINQKMIVRLLECNKYNADIKQILKKMNNQLKLISKNLLLSQRILDGLIDPPPVTCPTGHICVPVRLIPGLSLDLDIDPKALSIKVTLKVFGAPVFSGTFSISNPTIGIGGEFGLFLAELTLRGEFGDIAHGHFRIILTGRACIGPPVDFLRECTGFNQIVYDQ